MATRVTISTATTGTQLSLRLPLLFLAAGLLEQPSAALLSLSAAAFRSNALFVARRRTHERDPREGNQGNPGSTPAPTLSPSDRPTVAPSSLPTLLPSGKPSDPPSFFPVAFPSFVPSDPPSSSPTPVPSGRPSDLPSSSPTPVPSGRPSDLPSSAPSAFQSGSPSDPPSSSPSPVPSSVPSATPTQSTFPTSSPSVIPSQSSFPSPSPGATRTPTAFPTFLPSALPSHSSFPSSSPSFPPSSSPSATPTQSTVPTSIPSAIPSRSSLPSSAPSVPPSAIPTQSSYPSFPPSTPPSQSPSSECKSNATGFYGFSSQSLVLVSIKYEIETNASRTTSDGTIEYLEDSILPQVERAFVDLLLPSLFPWECGVAGAYSWSSGVLGVVGVSPNPDESTMEGVSCQFTVANPIHNCTVVNGGLTVFTDTNATTDMQSNVINAIANALNHSLTFDYAPYHDNVVRITIISIDDKSGTSGEDDRGDSIAGAQQSKQLNAGAANSEGGALTTSVAIASASAALLIIGAIAFKRRQMQNRRRAVQATEIGGKKDRGLIFADVEEGTAKGTAGGGDGWDDPDGNESIGDTSVTATLMSTSLTKSQSIGGGTVEEGNVLTDPPPQTFDDESTGITSNGLGVAATVGTGAASSTLWPSMTKSDEDERIKTLERLIEADDWDGIKHTASQYQVPSMSSSERNLMLGLGKSASSGEKAISAASIASGAIPLPADDDATAAALTSTPQGKNRIIGEGGTGEGGAGRGLSIVPHLHNDNGNSVAATASATPRNMPGQTVGQGRGAEVEGQAQAAPLVSGIGSQSLEGGGGQSRAIDSAGNGKGFVSNGIAAAGLGNAAAAAAVGTDGSSSSPSGSSSDEREGGPSRVLASVGNEKASVSCGIAAAAAVGSGSSSSSPSSVSSYAGEEGPSKALTSADNEEESTLYGIAAAGLGIAAAAAVVPGDASKPSSAVGGSAGKNGSASYGISVAGNLGNVGGEDRGMTADAGGSASHSSSLWPSRTQFDEDERIKILERLIEADDWDGIKRTASHYQVAPMTSSERNLILAGARSGSSDEESLDDESLKGNLSVEQ